jgi:hypothetical protein
MIHAVLHRIMMNCKVVTVKSKDDSGFDWQEPELDAVEGPSRCRGEASSRKWF